MFVDELRLSARRHLRQRGFALTVICTLALAIGASTAVFAIVNTILVRALPFASPDRVVWVSSVRTDNASAPFTLPEFMDYRARARSLSGLAAFTYWAAGLAGDAGTERLTGARMSGNAFDVLGISPAAGRLLTENDDRPDAPPVVLLSHQLWRQRYGAAPDVIGRTARINATAYTIVGVLPPHVPLPLLQADVVTPLAPERDPLRYLRGSVNFLRLFGRLQPGTDAARAQAELTAICRSLRQQFPIEYARKDSVRVAPVHEVLVADSRTVILLLFAAVCLVLAVALANLVSLVLVRGNSRRAELAMRIVLGASRLRLARQVCVETLLLTLIGSTLGWMLAGEAVDLARRVAPASIPRIGESTLDATAALFVAGVAVFVTIVLTAATLTVTAGGRAADGLSGATRGAIGDRWNRRVRSGLVIAEISAALVLLLATGVLLQNLRRLHDLDPGFQPDDVFQGRISLPTTYQSPEQIARFYDELSARIAASPGVRQVGVISIAPFSGLLAAVPFSPADRPLPDRDRPFANVRVISPQYLSTVGTRVREGRAFSEHDRADAPRVALVSAGIAGRFLSGRAVGRQLLIDDNNDGPRAIEVVGVVENVRQEALDRPSTLDIYLPLRQMHPSWMSALRNNQFWMVKTVFDPAAFQDAFQRHVRAVDPDVAMAGARSMRDALEASLGPRRFTLGLIAAFALTAVCLAVIGLYGLVSYAVGQRAREIGLRMAVGATEGDVKRLILGEAAALAGGGAAIGLLLAGVARPVITRVFPQVARQTSEDAWLNPAVAGVTAVLLLVVVLVAAWVPARRAARIEPTLALKT